MRKGSIGYNGKSWYFRIDNDRDPITGKRQQVYRGNFTTKESVEEALKDWKKENTLNNDEPCPLFSNVMEEWLINKVKPFSSSKTHTDYRSICEKYFDPYLGSMKVNEIKSRHIDEYLIDVKNDEQIGNTTIYNHLKRLKTILNFAIDREYITTNPANKVNIKKPTNKAFVISLDQVESLFNYIKNSYPLLYPIYYTGLLSGMRRGEFLAIKWSDINFDNQTIKIDKALSIDSSKPDKSKLYEVISEEKKMYLVKPKTSNSCRTITVSDKLINMLKKHKFHQEKLKSKLGKYYNDLNFVFAETDGYPHDPNEITRKFKHAVKKCNDIPNKYHLHSLRHQWASIALQGYNGTFMSIVRVTKHLGHSKIATTLDYYSHLIPSDTCNMNTIFNNVLNF